MSSFRSVRLSFNDISTPRSFLSRPSVFILIIIIALISLPGTMSQSTPYFDPSIPSCVACQKDYSTFDSCIRSSAILQNFWNAVFDPVGFFNAFKCACGDTFLKVYPLCLYCFQQTGQTNTLLNTTVPPSVEQIRATCQAGSAIAGNASGYDQTATSGPKPTGSAYGGAERLAVARWGSQIWFMVIMGIATLISAM